jgi:hypothetical protein
MIPLKHLDEQGSPQIGLSQANQTWRKQIKIVVPQSFCTRQEQSLRQQSAWNLKKVKSHLSCVKRLQTLSAIPKSHRQKIDDPTLKPWNPHCSLETDLQIAMNDRIFELRKQGGVL